MICFYNHRIYSLNFTSPHECLSKVLRWRCTYPRLDGSGAEIDFFLRIEKNRRLKNILLPVCHSFVGLYLLMAHQAPYLKLSNHIFSQNICPIHTDIFMATESHKGLWWIWGKKGSHIFWREDQLNSRLVNYNLTLLLTTLSMPTVAAIILVVAVAPFFVNTSSNVGLPWNWCHGVPAANATQIGSGDPDKEHRIPYHQFLHRISPQHHLGERDCSA